MTAQIPHFAAQFLNAPMLVHAPALSAMLSRGFGAFMPERQQEFDETDLPLEGRSIAIIGAYGPMIHRAGFGLASYEGIGADFDKAMADPSVAGILFDLETPGGAGSGAFQLADKITSARGRKPIWAIANESAFSAGYAIASAADRVIVTQTGGVGSVGVVWLHADMSGLDERLGVTITPIFAGAKKVDGWSHGPLTERARRDRQAVMDQMYEAFVALVAQNRGMSPDAVKRTEAGLFYGQDAVNARLADEVASFDEAIEMLAAEISGPALRGGSSARFSNPNKELVMSKRIGLDAKAGENAAEAKAENAGSVPATTATDPTPQPPVTAAAPPSPPSLSPEAIQKAADEARAAAQATALEITELCALAGAPGMAAEYLRKGSTPDAVRADLMKLRAENEADTRINNHHGPGAATDHGWGNVITRLGIGKQ